MPMDRHELEEAAAGVRDFARLMKAMFDGFREVGFNEEQALKMVQTWITANA